MKSKIILSLVGSLLLSSVSHASGISCVVFAENAAMKKMRSILRQEAGGSLRTREQPVYQNTYFLNDNGERVYTETSHYEIVVDFYQPNRNCRQFVKVNTTTAMVGGSETCKALDVNTFGDRDCTTDFNPYAN